jgi:hypothetical protein
MPKKVENALVIFESPLSATYGDLEKTMEAIRKGEITEVVALSGRERKICPKIGGKFVPFSQWGLSESTSSVKVTLTNPSQVEGILSVGDHLRGNDVWYLTVGADIELDDAA